MQCVRWILISFTAQMCSRLHLRSVSWLSTYFDVKLDEYVGFSDRAAGRGIWSKELQDKQHLFSLCLSNTVWETLSVLASHRVSRIPDRPDLHSSPRGLEVAIRAVSGVARSVW